MTRHRLALVPLLALAAVCLAAPGVDYAGFKTDAETDQWLAKNSATYATIVKEIKARKDIRGYRFVSKSDIPRGMAAWVDDHLEIQLHPTLKGPDRISTLIFEMANASRSRDHFEIDLAVDNGLITTPQEFGLAHELLEYEALRTYRQILVEMEASSGAVPKEFFYFVTPTPRSLEEFQLPGIYPYLKAQKESGHTAHYHKHFHLRKAALQPKE